jgi:hypothetical protein
MESSVNKITLSDEFIAAATSANIYDEIVTVGPPDVVPMLEQVSKDVAEAVLAAQKEQRANDAVHLFGSRINPPRKR